MQQKFNWPSFADLVLIGQPQIHKGDLWGGDNGSIFSQASWPRFVAKQTVSKDWS